MWRSTGPGHCPDMSWGQAGCMVAELGEKSNLRKWELTQQMSPSVKTACARASLKPETVLSLFLPNYYNMCNNYLFYKALHCITTVKLQHSITFYKKSKERVFSFLFFNSPTKKWCLGKKKTKNKNKTKTCACLLQGKILLNSLHFALSLQNLPHIER